MTDSFEPGGVFNFADLDLSGVEPETETSVSVRLRPRHRDIKTVARMLEERRGEWLPKLAPNGRQEGGYYCLGDPYGGAPGTDGGSFKVPLAAGRAAILKDMASGWVGDDVALWASLKNRDNNEAWIEADGWLGSTGASNPLSGHGGRERAGRHAGVSEATLVPISPSSSLPKSHATYDLPRRLTAKEMIAFRLWKSAGLVEGTVAAEALANRGHQGPFDPDAFRFLLKCRVAKTVGPVLLIRRQSRTGGFCVERRPIVKLPDGRLWTGASRHLGELGDLVLRGTQRERYIVAVTEGFANALAIREAFPALTAVSVGPAGQLANWSPPSEASEIAIFSDTDPAGLKGAYTLANKLQASGKTVTVVEPRAFKDVAEAFECTGLSGVMRLWMPKGLDTRDDLLALPPKRYLVEGIIPRGSLVALLGDPNVGKSTVATAIACCVSAGADFIGRKTTKMPVVFIAAEGRLGILNRQLAWEIDSGRRCGHLVVSGNEVMLDKPTQLEALIDKLLEFKKRCGEIGLIVVDTVTATKDGAEDNEGMALYIRQVRRLAEATSAAILLLHHPPKNNEARHGAKAARGGSSFFAALDAAFQLKGSGGRIEMVCEKMRDDIYPDPMTFTLESVDLTPITGTSSRSGEIRTGVIVKGAALMAVPKVGRPKSADMKMAEAAILDALGSGETTAVKLSEALGIPTGNVTNALQGLKRKGYATVSGQRWKVGAVQEPRTDD